VRMRSTNLHRRTAEGSLPYQTAGSVVSISSVWHAVDASRQRVGEAAGASRRVVGMTAAPGRVGLMLLQHSRRQSSRTARRLVAGGRTAARFGRARNVDSPTPARGGVL
jgi:hypothetical protein